MDATYYINLIKFEMIFQVLVEMFGTLKVANATNEGLPVPGHRVPL